MLHLRQLKLNLSLAVKLAAYLHHLLLSCLELSLLVLLR
jgi:hypothetical protein